MDFIKIALITAIAITLYYLLLQWPNETQVYEPSDELLIENKALIESNDSLTDTLSPMENVNVPSAPILLPVRPMKWAMKICFYMLTPTAAKLLAQNCFHLRKIWGEKVL